MELLKRIDKALETTGKTRADLARELGISTQAINGMAKRPGATMKHENLVRAAQALSTTVEWLTTGKGAAPRAQRQEGQPVPVYDREAAERTEQAEMVASMFRHLGTEDRRETVAFIASRLAKTQRSPA